MKHWIFYLLAILLCGEMYAQSVDYGKLSPSLRRLARLSSHTTNGPWRVQGVSKSREPIVVSFVKSRGDVSDLLHRHHCQVLARKGSLAIAAIPASQLGPLSTAAQVMRIEGEPSANRLTMDSMAVHLNALPAYQGQALPQAFTGQGVVVGVMDIGFDLTHPTFYDSTGTHYRIKALWDQLSTDTVGSPWYVGRDYKGDDALLALGRSRDGDDQTHGTHTTGIAAGSGYDSPYRGMAWESDICLVANATTENLALIDSADYYKYTYATDALGFKYIFDYADEQGKPCVINFSEGSHQDLHGYDQLYYEMLDSLLGPGHILVASAGNEGHLPSYLHKKTGTISAGTFVSSSSNQLALTARSDTDFVLRLVCYGDSRDTLLIPTREVVQAQDSVWRYQWTADNQNITVEVGAYANCYAPDTETAYDLTLTGEKQFNTLAPMSIEVEGEQADVQLYRGSGEWYTNDLNPQLVGAETTHNILSPAAAPRVICVGSTSYRTQITNYLGEQQRSDWGTGGVRGGYSSVGPTFDGRIKPDVMAPGSNVISSYSSYYLEHHPQAGDISWDVKHFDWQGRTYAWNSNLGTSMASPAVAGAIALWLQADPELTPEQAMEVIANTSTHYDPSLSYPNNYYGYGQIDVYQGLLHLLGLTGIPGISLHPAKRFVVSSTPDGVTVTSELPTDRPHNISVYTTAGTKVAAVTMPAGQSSCTLQWQGHGVFLVQVEGDGSSLIRK